MKPIVLVFVSLLFLLTITATAQNPPLAFEATSIKPHALTGAGGAVGMRVSGSLVTLSAVTLKRLIAEAYGVRDYQIEGGPDSVWP